jgi:hypothetical protein
MMIEVDDDYVDTIIVAGLASSYISVRYMLKSGKGWHEDDIAAWEELLPAIELVGGWYSTDFKADIKKAKKAHEKIHSL